MAANGEEFNFTSSVSNGPGTPGEQVAAGNSESDEAYLKTTSLRIMQIYLMYKRLSVAFSGENRYIEGKSTSELVRTPEKSSNNPKVNERESGIGSASDDLNVSAMLSPSERAKYLRLMDKLNRVRSVHIFCRSDEPELHRFRLDMCPNLESLVLELVPPSTVLSFASLRDRLQVFEVVNSGIPSLRSLLAPDVPNSSLSVLSPIVIAHLPSMHSPLTKSNGKDFPLQSSGTGASDVHAEDEDTMTALTGFMWKRLTLLRLRNCGLASLDASLHLLPEVTTLDLSYNDITHIVHLHNCRGLRTLDLSHNRVRVLSNLDRVLGNVLELDLSYNHISNLDGIQKLYSLISLNLAGNKIDDVVEVRHLSRLPCLEQVTLSTNPIAEQSMYRIFVYAQLLCDGRMMNSSRDVPMLDNEPMTRNEIFTLRGMLFRAPENKQGDLSARNNSAENGGMHGHLLGDDGERSSVDSTSRGASPARSPNGTPHGSSHGEDALVMALGSINTSAHRDIHPFGGAAGLGGSSLGSARTKSSSGINSFLSVGGAEDAMLGRTLSTGSSVAGAVLGGLGSGLIADLSLTHAAAAARGGRSTSRDNGPGGGKRKGSGKPLDAASFGPSGQVLVTATTSSPSRFAAGLGGKIVDRSSLHSGHGSLGSGSTSTGKSRKAKKGTHRSRRARVDKRASRIVTVLEGASCQELYPDLGDVARRLEERTHLRRQAKLVSARATAAPVVNGRRPASPSVDSSSTSSEEEEEEEETEKEPQLTSEEVEAAPADRSGPSPDAASSDVLDGDSAAHMEDLVVVTTETDLGTNKAASLAARMQSKWAAKAAGVTTDADSDAELATAAAAMMVSINTSITAVDISSPPCDVLPTEAVPPAHVPVPVVVHSPPRQSVTAAVGADSLALPFLESRASTPVSSHTYQRYTGNPDYGACSVRDNLELYMREQVVGTGKDVLKLYALWEHGRTDGLLSRAPTAGSDAACTSIMFPQIDSQPLSSTGAVVEDAEAVVPFGAERFCAYFEETTLLLGSAGSGRLLATAASGSISRRDLSGSAVSALPRASVDVTSVGASSSPGAVGANAISEPTEVQLGILVTTRYMYFFLVDSERLTHLKFTDAPLLPVLSVHPLTALTTLWVYFGLQRCMLGFDRCVYPPQNSADSAAPATGDEVRLYRYMVLTRNKARTHPIVTRIPQAANALRLAADSRRSKVAIINMDAQLIEVISVATAALSKPRSSAFGAKEKEETKASVDICHYQMLYQVWRKLPNVSDARTLVITDKYLFLCTENYSSVDVQLTVLDSAPITDVAKAQAEADPLCVTVIFRPSSVLGITGRKWRLKATDTMASQKLLAEILKIK